MCALAWKLAFCGQLRTSWTFFGWFSNVPSLMMSVSSMWLLAQSRSQNGFITISWNLSGPFLIPRCFDIKAQPCMSWHPEPALAQLFHSTKIPTQCCQSKPVRCDLGNCPSLLPNDVKLSKENDSNSTGEVEKLNFESDLCCTELVGCFNCLFHTCFEELGAIWELCCIPAPPR